MLKVIGGYGAENRATNPLPHLLKRGLGFRLKDEERAGFDGAHLLVFYNCGPNLALQGIALANHSGVLAGALLDRAAVTREAIVREWKESLSNPTAFAQMFGQAGDSGVCLSYPGRQNEPPGPLGSFQEFQSKWAIRYFERFRGIFYKDPATYVDYKDLSEAWAIASKYLADNMRLVQGEPLIKSDFKAQNESRKALIEKLRRGEFFKIGELPALFGGQPEPPLLPVDYKFWHGETEEEARARQAADEAAALAAKQAAAEPCQRARTIAARFELDDYEHWQALPLRVKEHLLAIFLAHSQALIWFKRSILLGLEKGEPVLPLFQPVDYRVLPKKTLIDHYVWQKNVDWIEPLNRLGDTSITNRFVHVDGHPLHDRSGRFLKKEIEQAELEIYISEVKMGGQGNQDRIIFEFKLPERVVREQIIRGVRTSITEPASVARYHYAAEIPKLKPLEPAVLEAFRRGEV